MQIEDFLCGTLQPLHRRERQGPNVHGAEAHQRDQRDPATLLHQAHSSTVKRNRKLASDTNTRSEEHTSELQSPCNLVCRLLLEKKKIEPRMATCVRFPQTPHSRQSRSSPCR